MPGSANSDRAPQLSSSATGNGARPTALDHPLAAAGQLVAGARDVDHAELDAVQPLPVPPHVAGDRPVGRSGRSVGHASAAARSRTADDRAQPGDPEGVRLPPVRGVHPGSRRGSPVISQRDQLDEHPVAVGRVGHEEGAGAVGRDPHAAPGRRPARLLQVGPPPLGGAPAVAVPRQRPPRRDSRSLGTNSSMHASPTRNRLAFRFSETAWPAQYSWAPNTPG